MANRVSTSSPTCFHPFVEHSKTCVVVPRSRTVRRGVPSRISADNFNYPSTRQRRQKSAGGRDLYLRAQPEVETATPTSLEDTYRLTLSTAEARKSLRFREIFDGGAMRIVVDAVAIGSEAEQEGVRPGQRLLGVSDPIRTNENWEVVPGTSLSRVRDAIQFRRPPTISFLFSQASVEDDAEWSLEDAQKKRLESAEEDSSELSSSGEPNGETGLNSALLANITGQDEEVQTNGANNGNRTIADQLQEQQRSLEADGAREQAKLKARMQKRREYMDRESGRNDAPFFALLLSFFVLPAAVILLIAFSSGYLDTIADSYRRF